MASKSVGMFDDNRSGMRKGPPGSAPSALTPSPQDAPTDMPVGSPLDQFQLNLARALERSEFALARSIVSEAEENAQGPTPLTSIRPVDLTIAKARIAIARNDEGAARAILVTAIERHPKDQALRTLLAEVMLASGQATNVRPVLRHIGNDPASAEATHTDPIPPRTQGTST
ncbi:hypothetical protein V8J82_19315 [Gymnodinialimonas sp. 2305UL16-5]|uniref:tetratricopeptide repeat protein n=1 Tax=Gymnodinialimonas mytili TaxID=3126503 RepID=UPI0030AA30AA